MNSTSQTKLKATSTTGGRKKWLLPVVILVCASLTGFWIAQTRSSAVPRIDLSIGAEHLDFGEPWATHEFQWKLPMVNRGEDMVTVKHIFPSCQCLSVTPNAFVLQPGETVDVDLLLNLFDFRQSKEPRYRDQASRITAIIDTGVPGTPLRKITWTVHGRVRIPVSVKPDQITYFGADRLISGTAGSPKRLELEAHWQLAEVVAKCDPELGNVRISRSEAEEPHFTLVFIPQVQHDPGSLEGEIHLTAIGKDGKPLPQRRIPVIGNIAPDFHSAPSALNFGTIHVGMTGNGSALIQSASGKKFEIERIATEDVVSVKRNASKGELASSFAFLFEVKATASGNQSRKVTFHINTEGNTTETVVLPVTYYGI